MFFKKTCSVLIAIVIILLTPSYVVASEDQKLDKNALLSKTEDVELTELRETNSETILHSDGTAECIVYLEDKYYMDSSGELQLIDNSIPNK